MTYREQPYDVEFYERGPLLCAVLKFYSRTRYCVGFKHRLLKFNIKVSIPRPSYWRNELVKKTKTFLLWCNPFPVYYAVDSMDCDCYRTVTAHKAKNGRSFFKSYDQIYWDAEGPTSVWVITKQEYESFKPQARDLALEAFEDGHPHVVYR